MTFSLEIPWEDGSRPGQAIGKDQSWGWFARRSSHCHSYRNENRVRLLGDHVSSADDMTQLPRYFRKGHEYWRRVTSITQTACYDEKQQKQLRLGYGVFSGDQNSRNANKLSDC